MRKFPKFEEMVLPTTMHAELVKLLGLQGVAESDLLEGTGIRPGMLGSPEARLSLLQAAVLAANALRLTGDPALGLEFGRHIHINGVGPVKFERNSPISAYSDRPNTAAPTFQLMQVQARKVHILRRLGRVESGQYESKLWRVRCLNSRFRST